MERLQEIEARKKEIKDLLESEQEVNVDELEAEVKSLEEEAKKIEAQLEETRKANKEEEQRAKRQEIAKAINERKIDVQKLNEKDEKNETMEERKFDLGSKEYRSGWAKKMMGLSADKFTEDEKRALGDAITTTATTFVEATEDTNGINNAGLLIPTSVRKELMDIVYKTSPFLRDVRKFSINGNVDLPYLHEADDANWYTETSCTTNEGAEFKQVQLTGWELAKDIVITWKAEKMTVEGFIDFIIQELSMKMGKALANAVIYGDGNNKPTGAIYNLEALTDVDPIQVIKKAKASLPSDFKIGAKVYISEDVGDAIVFAKDNNGTYPYLQGVPRIFSLAVEVDPFLTNNDIIVGNPMNYVLNEVEGVSLAKSTDVKCRRTTYGGYAMYDGKPRPNAFAKGQVVSVSL